MRFLFTWPMPRAQEKAALEKAQAEEEEEAGWQLVV